MLIDTHAHLYLDQFKNDIDEVIASAKNINVSKIFLPNIDKGTLQDVTELCNKYPSECYAMIGLHPCSVKNDFEEELNQMFSHFSEFRYYGVGETGIDLYWDKTTKDLQIRSFEIQIDFAKKHDLPVIIHSREALDLCIEIIDTYQDGDLKGIFHCFNGTIKQCQKVADLNFHMGLGGIVTYKNSGLDDMIKYMPGEKMLLETDAPYLTPVPYRGKRNESAYLSFITEKIAELRDCSFAEIAGNTSRNALQLFGLE